MSYPFNYYGGMAKKLTSREKAIDLAEKFKAFTPHYEFAKKCAIIAVDEVLSQITPFISGGQGGAQYDNPEYTYWMEVKAELE